MKHTKFEIDDNYQNSANIIKPRLMTGSTPDLKQLDSNIAHPLMSLVQSEPNLQNLENTIVTHNKQIKRSNLCDLSNRAMYENSNLQYINMSASMIMDKKASSTISTKMVLTDSSNKRLIPKNTQQYSEPNIPLNKIYKWVDDDLVTCCQKCNKPFAFFLRRHHCRSCGRIFCYACSNYSIEIPADFALLQLNDAMTAKPKTNLDQTDNATITNKTKSRVCHNCYQKIHSYNNVNSCMIIFKYVKLDVRFLVKIKSVCKTWAEFADIRLNKLREIQYVLPNHIFTDLEKELLWTNYYHLVYHPKYLVQLLRSIDHQAYAERESKLNIILDLLKKKTNYINQPQLTCSNLMCTRYCKPKILQYANSTNLTNSTNSKNSTNLTKQHKPIVDSIKYILTPEDATNLLNNNVKDTAIRKFAIRSFANIDNSELICYIPFLVFSIRYESIENSIIGDFLISKCVEEIASVRNKEHSAIELCNEIYWEFQIQIEQKTLSKDIIGLYKYMTDKLMAKIPLQYQTYIIGGKKFVETMVGLHGKSEDVIKEKLNQLSSNGTKSFAIPISTNIDYWNINIDKLQIMSSASMPVIFPLISDKNHTMRKIMFKFEDIRKDQIIILLIKLIEIILTKDDNMKNISILTYKVRPTGLNHGLVSIVPNAHTIYFIKDTLGFSLLNYIIENNRTESIESIRNRFLHSCAIYCVITYIFGIGDRHPGNIMVTNEGVLFHIDFGYILGSDPKPLTNPTMRISADMVDVLGGINSQYYKKFTELCTEIYNAIRRHVNLFITMLLILSESSPPIIDSATIYDEIIKKFAPGENCHQAEIQLSSVIDNSSQSYKHTLIDYIHSFGQQSKMTLTTANKSIWSSVVGLFGGNK